MSDGSELEPVEFKLEIDPVIPFTATDIVAQLTPVQVVRLIKELDTELNEWEATVLLAGYFAAQLAEAPPEDLTKSDEELMGGLRSLETAVAK